MRKLRSLLLGAVLAATAVPAQTAQAAPITFWPIGTWQAMVKVSEHPPHKSTIELTKSGKLCMSFGAPGEASGTGTGIWQVTGHNQFAFELTHDVILPDGTLIAYVTARHSANQNHRDKFSSSGETVVTDPEGNPEPSGPSSIEATRTSFTTTCQ